MLQMSKRYETEFKNVVLALAFGSRKPSIHQKNSLNLC